MVSALAQSRTHVKQEHRPCTLWPSSVQTYINVLIEHFINFRYLVNNNGLVILSSFTLTIVDANFVLVKCLVRHRGLGTILIIVDGHGVCTILIHSHNLTVMGFLRYVQRKLMMVQIHFLYKDVRTWSVYTNSPYIMHVPWISPSPCRHFRGPEWIWNVDKGQKSWAEKSHWLGLIFNKNIYSSRTCIKNFGSKSGVVTTKITSCSNNFFIDHVFLELASKY